MYTCIHICVCGYTHIRTYMYIYTCTIYLALCIAQTHGVRGWIRQKHKSRFPGTIYLDLCFAQTHGVRSWMRQKNTSPDFQGDVRLTTALSPHRPSWRNYFLQTQLSSPYHCLTVYRLTTYC